MKFTAAILPALLASPALAAPYFSASPSEIAAQAFDSAQNWIHHAVQGATKHWADHEASTKVEGLVTSNVRMNDIDYLALSHPSFPDYKLRVVSPNLCDGKVHQLSGYLDISETKHLFFWFEASRRKPEEDPLVLWLNGGPGCSSTTGHLFELGACNIAEKGENTTYNDWSWNEVANVIFLDQPVGVGFSYSDDESVKDSHVAAEDVYAFLMLFISQFREYSTQDFHVAGESYAGTYIPNIAHTIYNHNLALQLAPTPKLPVINFKSVLIGDGLTDPYLSFGTFPAYACESDYAVYKPGSPECQKLEANGAQCQRLIQACYKTGSRFACTPAGLYCFSRMFGDFQNLGLNIYDVRRKCDKSEDKDGPLCYPEMGWIETYLNRPEIKKELGVPSTLTFASCNMNINRDFLLNGDGMHYAGALLVPLVDAGIRVLLYNGEADYIINAWGTQQTLEALETSYQTAYLSSPRTNFTDTDGKVVGWTQAAGKGAGNVAFVSFRNAGHMVPHDDPKGALAMFSRWLDNKPLA